MSLLAFVWGNACSSIPPMASMSAMPSMPVLTPGSVKPLSGEVGTLKHKITLMEKRLSETQKERDQTLEQLRNVLQERTAAMEERSRRLQSGLRTIDQPTQTTPQQNEQFAAMHRSAYTSYQRGDYQVAYDRYMQIYEKAPSPAQKGQALFWAAECAYGKRNWGLAINTFNRFREEFPADPLVPSALLRTATAYLQNDQPQEARNTLQALVEEYPKTEEAELGRRRLEALSDS